MLSIFINNFKYNIPKSSTILNVCNWVNEFIPKFCFNSDLGIAGNCRMCLVEIEGAINPVMSCTSKIFDNIVIYTNSPLVKKSRENILEFLLINHPLDCPICDQGGECDLQDINLMYGSDRSRFVEIKKTVEDLPNDPFIKTIMTRCILCTKCVRFMDLISNQNNLGIIGRGKHMEIGFYIKDVFKTEFSSNIVDLCPVGALTLRPSQFTVRNWYVKKYYSFDIFDSLCSNIIVHVTNNNVVKITPNIKLGSKYISNYTRFFFDSIFKNRLFYPAFKNSKRIFESLEWRVLIKILKNLFKNNDPSLFNVIIGNFVDYSSLFSLYNLFNNTGIQQIEYKGYNLKNLNFDFSSNFFISSRKLEEKKIFLLVGCNVNSECINLDLFFSLQKNKSNIKIYSIGSKVNNLYSVVHLGISIVEFIKILEGKHFFSKELKKNKSIIFFGQEFFKLSYGYLLLNYMRNTYKKLDFFIIFKEVSFLNFLEIYNNNLITHKKKKKILYLYNTKNFLRRYSNLNLTKYLIIYHGQHVTADSLLSDVLIPCNTFFEKDNLYINCKGQLKKSNSFIKNYSIKSNRYMNEAIFFSFLNKNINKTSIIYKKTFLYFKDSLIILTKFNFNLNVNFNYIFINIFKNKIKNYNIIKDNSFTLLSNINIILSRNFQKKNYNIF